MDPAVATSQSGPSVGARLAEVDLDVVIARHALVLAAAEGVEVAAVERADDFGDVVAVVVDGAGDGRAAAPTAVMASFAGGIDEALVDEDLGACGMIDGHQREIVVVVRLPQFAGDAEIVVAIVRHELVAPRSCTTLRWRRCAPSRGR